MFTRTIEVSFLAYSDKKSRRPKDVELWNPETVTFLVGQNISISDLDHVLTDKQRDALLGRTGKITSACITRTGRVTLGMRFSRNVATIFDSTLGNSGDLYFEHEISQHKAQGRDFHRIHGISVGIVGIAPCAGPCCTTKGN